MLPDDFKNKYEGIFEPELIAAIAAVAVEKQVKEGEILMDIGQPLLHIPLVLNGAIKILREDKEGEELLLYFIEHGDTCAMTLSCCMGQKKSEIRAVAETDARLLMLPVSQMEVWMAEYPSWRRFILDSYHSRMMELLDAVDTVAFMNMEERLLKYLQDKAMVTHDASVKTTHQQIANDMHTSRVVVSRMLKQLERAGKIQLGRNQVTVLSL
ncbi:Crp/Fnr family transcriptional regulator [Zeaxanthinibacter enoshimensis]|uniref:CRP/FNR family transcriptional regulator n=1 Tax=Zeaxanthinibacter enoshimensis TaxID=392009 RepID=A0A4R6TIH2_9FLAO|nr:Crp/Fnr family transcriptional regulator [Zeaxanthinibacter enoshimensis]TDQ29060.1 CRP/FNR family transcriptional regulator [Zeaxanthinibacter enoshimensis]